MTERTPSAVQGLSLKKRRLGAQLALAAFTFCLGYLVLVPLIRLQAVALSNGAAGYRTAFSSDILTATLKNTVGLAAGSLVISLFFGTLLAWWASRLPPRLRFLRALPILPIVLPAVANVSGWAFLLSPRPGYLNGLLRLLPWWSTLDSGPFDVYSIFGIIFVTGFLLSGFIYLFVSAGLQNINAELIEAARCSGSSALGAFMRVTLPLLRPVLLHAGGVALLLGLGQFTAPLLLGMNANVRVLTTEMYMAIQKTPVDFAAAAAMGSPLIVFGIFLVIVQKYFLGNQSRFVTHGGRAFRPAGKPSRLAAVGIISSAIITTGFPIGALTILALSPFWSAKIHFARFSINNFARIFRESAIVEALLNSVFVSLLAVAISLVIGFIVASILVRGRRQPILRVLLDIIVAMPLGVPAVIFGAGFLFTYSQPPIVLYGTWWVLLVVYVTLMLPFTTRMQVSGMLQLGSSYIEASRVSGASSLVTDLRITLPLMRTTLGGAGALMFALLTHEFTASLLVRSYNSQVLGTVLFDYWANGSYPLVAAIALIMTLVTVTGVLAATLIGGGDALNKL